MHLTKKERCNISKSWKTWLFCHCNFPLTLWEQTTRTSFVCLHFTFTLHCNSRRDQAIVPLQQNKIASVIVMGQQCKFAAYQCIYIAKEECSDTKLDRFVLFVWLHISIVLRPSNSELTGKKTCKLWMQVETQPLTFLSVPVHAEEWVEVCRSLREPLFTRWAGKPQGGGGGEASGCITQFRRGQEQKKALKMLPTAIVSMALALSLTHTHILQSTHTFTLSLSYWIHVTVFDLYCSY